MMRGIPQFLRKTDSDEMNDENRPKVEQKKDVLFQEVKSKQPEKMEKTLNPCLPLHDEKKIEENREEIYEEQESGHIPIQLEKPQSQMHMDSYVNFFPFKNESVDEMEVNSQEKSIKPPQYFTPSRENKNNFLQNSEQVHQRLDYPTSLLHVANIFRLFTQTLNTTHSYHKLSKKDSLSKVYSSIYNVISQENLKMEGSIIEEVKAHNASVNNPFLLKIEQEIPMQYSHYTPRKELIETMDSESNVKLEEIPKPPEK